MQNVETNELVGLFEAIHDNDEKIRTHKETCKMIGADSAAHFKEFAKEKELSEKNLKNAYKYYVEHVVEGEDKSDDYFTLCALVDNIDDGKEKEEDA